MAQIVIAQPNLSVEFARKDSHGTLLTLDKARLLAARLHLVCLNLVADMLQKPGRGKKHKQRTCSSD